MRRNQLAVVALILIVLCLPLFVKDYYLGVLTLICIYAIGTLGLELLMGYGGQISLGHGGFVALGVYFTAYFDQLGYNPILTLCIAVAGTVLIAYLIGMPILRLEGYYLAIATLAFGILIQSLAIAMYGVTGGSSGKGLSYLTLFGVPFAEEHQYYYFVLAFLVPLFLFARNISRTRRGRSYVAIQSDEAAARALGIPTSKVKLEVFMLSSAYAAVCGFLLAYYLNFVSPDIFGVVFSIDFIVMSLLGGHGTIYAPLIGSFVWVWINELIRPFKDYKLMVTGIVLALIILFFQRGIYGLVTDLKDRWSRRSGNPLAEGRENI